MFAAQINWLRLVDYLSCFQEGIICTIYNQHQITAIQRGRSCMTETYHLTQDNILSISRSRERKKRDLTRGKATQIQFLFTGRILLDAESLKMLKKQPGADWGGENGDVAKLLPDRFQLWHIVCALIRLKVCQSHRGFVRRSLCSRQLVCDTDLLFRCLRSCRREQRVHPALQDQI